MWNIITGETGLPRPAHCSAYLPVSLKSFGNEQMRFNSAIVNLRFSSGCVMCAYSCSSAHEPSPSETCLLTIPQPERLADCRALQAVERLRHVLGRESD